MPVSASQRVNLIGLIARELRQQDASQVFMILHQFSIPYLELEVADEAYVREMIKDVADTTLSNRSTQTP
jgi:hypothetical protein